MITEKSIYNFEESLFRIDQMLNFQISEEETRSSIPNLNVIPAKGGVITNCSVMQMEMTPSSSSDYSQLLRVYRAFLSETVAILASNINCVDIKALGTQLTAVFNTPFKNNIETLIDKTAMINTLAQIVTKKAKRLGLPGISVKIGVDYGNVMLMRYGKLNNDEVYPKGLVWIGKPVEGAQMLVERPVFGRNIWISDVVFQNLSEEYTKFFQREKESGCYCADIINMHMKSWLNKQ